jgi:hypothetical protein
VGEDYSQLSAVSRQQSAFSFQLSTDTFPERRRLALGDTPNFLEKSSKGLAALGTTPNRWGADCSI